MQNMQTNNTGNNVAPFHSNHSANANINNIDENERITNGIIANQCVHDNQSPLTNNDTTNSTATTNQSNPPFNTRGDTERWKSGGELIDNVGVKTSWESVAKGWTVHDRANQNGVFRSNLKISRK